MVPEVYITALRSWWQRKVAWRCVMRFEQLRESILSR